MSNVFHRSLRSVPETAISAKGMTIMTASGREILDGSGGAAVSCLGHSHPAVIDAVKGQVEKLAFAHTGFLTSEPAEQLAELLVGHRPGGLSKAYFVSGGSEAIEAAIKLARQYFVELGQPHRTRFIARRQGYHGNTLGALSASGNPFRQQPYQPLLSDAFIHVSPAFAYHYQRATETEAEYCARLVAEIENEFERVGPSMVAAFLAEPVVGATAGAVTAPAGYFKAVRDICDRHGALLILDEVMCGMGRTGTLHAWEQEEVAPDLQCVAKGLGGGYQPIGAVLVQSRIIDTLTSGSGSFVHGHTYLAHPVACAAALAVQRVIAADNLLDRVQLLGSLLRDRLQDRFGQHAHVGDIRGRGLFQAIEIVEDRESKTPFPVDRDIAARIKAAALARGLICYPMNGTKDGREGDHVLLAPPYIASEDDIGRIVERLGDALDAVIASA